MLPDPVARPPRNKRKIDLLSYSAISFSGSTTVGLVVSTFAGPTSQTNIITFCCTARSINPEMAETLVTLI